MSVGARILHFGLLLVVAVLAAAGRPDRARRLLPTALWLLGLGIIAGSVWAEMSWGRYWGWDPKETWALITLLVAALPLHMRRPGRCGTCCRSWPWPSPGSASTSSPQTRCTPIWQIKN